MHLKLVQKKQLKKTTETTVGLIGINIADKITKVSKTSQQIVQRQFKMRMVNKYLKEDIHLYKKGRKLLMIWD